MTVAPAMAAAAPPTTGIVRRRVGLLRPRAVLSMECALRRTTRLATRVPTTYVAYPIAAFRLLSILAWYPFASSPNTTFRRVTACRRAADDAGMNPNDTATTELTVDERFVDDWIRFGISELEAYLGKHARFDAYCRRRDTAE